MQGSPRRGLASWIRRANSSCPLPLAPRISTGPLLRATRVALATSSSMACEQAINCRTSPEQGSPRGMRSGTLGWLAAMGLPSSVLAVCLEHPAALDELVDFGHEPSLTSLEVAHVTVDPGRERSKPFGQALQEGVEFRPRLLP